MNKSLEYLQLDYGVSMDASSSDVLPANDYMYIVDLYLMHCKKACFSTTPQRLKTY